MGAPIKEKNSSENFVSNFGNQKCLSRLISANGRPKRYFISKSTQANIPEITLAEISFSVPTSCISTTVTKVHVTAVEQKDGVADCYEKICCSFTDVKEQIQDVISHLGASQADMKRMKGLANVKEHIVDLKDKIKTLENHIGTTVMTESELILDTDGFTPLHGVLHRPDRKHSKEKQNMTVTIDILGDLLRLRVFPTYKLQSVPFTLESYFDSLSRGETTDASQSMSNEMLRLSSLSSFPRGINISMFSLARAGFYNTGRSSETKCYSCGATYKDWTSNDDPIVVHRNISPTCYLVRREAERSSVEGENRNINRNSEQICPNNGVSGQSVRQVDTASMYPSQLQPNTVSPHNRMTPTLNNVSTSCQSETTSRNRDVTTSSTSEQRANHTDLSLQNCQTPRNEPGTSASGQCNHTDDYSNLGINVKKPKYPNYAPLQDQANTSNDHTNSPQVNESAASNISPTTSRPSQQLQNVAVRSVLEMGYTNDQVLDALRKIQGTSSYDSHISATDIMKVLLDEDDSSIQGAASRVVKINSDDFQGLSSPDTESLIEENRQLRVQKLCKVCLDLDATIAFIPCGHFCCCDCTYYAEMSTLSFIHQGNSENIFSLTGSGTAVTEFILGTGLI